MALNSKYARRLRQRISRAQQERCCYCKRRFTRDGPKRATLEHRKPKRDGGRDAVSNLAVACFHCNQHRARQIARSRKAASQPAV